MKILDEYDRIARISGNIKKIAIPELPQTDDELSKLMVKNFTILHVDKSRFECGRERHIGRIVVEDILLKCPFCGMQFSGLGKSSYSGRTIFPDLCPNCNFPDNVFEAKTELWNKSRRLNSNF